MDFEKLYSKLPNFIKYNRVVLNIFLDIAKLLRKVINDKSNEISPYDFKVTNILKNTQLLNLELLRFIDNVCNKHNIDYWITGGTLLGAVRHGGFIPWDDDVDITFMREDYEKFIEVLPNEINRFDYFKQECGLTILMDNENYFNDFQSVYAFEGDEKLLNEYQFLFLQLAWMKPYAKIDCFPEDFVSEDKLDYFKKNYIITKYKFNEEFRNRKINFKDEFELICDELGFTRKKTKFFNDSLDTLNLYPISLRETKEVFPLTTINFEGYSFKCPKNYDYYLKLLFGSNYMELPKTIETHNIVPFIESQFNSKEEIDMSFKKNIGYLMKINDNFE